jgi:hypothetical protein
VALGLTYPDDAELVTPSTPAAFAGVGSRSVAGGNAAGSSLTATSLPGGNELRLVYLIGL